MNEKNELEKLKEELLNIRERLVAIEKEQRMIIEDILSGNPRERMKKRLLEKPSNKKEEIEKKLENLRIEI
ncbi:MAG: hypothetical protein DRN33_03655 [Thermoplasmata archaeon]|nr:MAG: hypothetical protein DRN33_03655 [Thermoplasmata archaeon]